MRDFVIKIIHQFFADDLADDESDRIIRSDILGIIHRAFFHVARKSVPQHVHVIALKSRDSVDIIEKPGFLIPVIEFEVLLRTYEIALVYSQNLWRFRIFQKLQQRLIAFSEVQRTVDYKQNNVNTA